MQSKTKLYLISILFVIVFKITDNTSEGATKKTDITKKLIEKAIDRMIVENAPPLFNKLPCYNDTNGDILQSINEVQLDENSIFFHETSCRGNLTPRQACSIESAALAHKKRQIFVLFSGPVTTSDKLRRVDLIPNVHCVRIHLNYTKGILENELKNVIYRSAYPVTHASDVLKFVTLYKYGGTYLDSDVMVVKSFEDLGRMWVGAEADIDPSSGVMDFRNDVADRKLLRVILDEIPKQGYDNWNTVGNNVLKIALRGHCNFTSVSNLTNGFCNDIKIYNRTIFYPIFYPSYLRYFNWGEVLTSEERSASYAHHMWNGITYKNTIEKGSIYSYLAKKYCPRTYKAFGSEFGNRQN